MARRRAALSALEGTPGVDASRVAMIGVVHGAEHAVAASLDDDRSNCSACYAGTRRETSARRRTSSAGPSTCCTSPPRQQQPWRSSSQGTTGKASNGHVLYWLGILLTATARRI